MENIKKLFHTAGTKHGTYSVGLTAVVVAIVVVVNLIIGQLPEQYRNIDVSSTKIYEISDISRDFLKELDQKVTFKVLAIQEDTDERIQIFLEKYAALSKNISVEWIDPVLHPSALSEYEASENSIVVSCEATGKTTTVAFTDIIVADMSSYYYTGNTTESEFDGEGQLTGAVNYVTNDVQKQIYRTTGHGEGTLSASITDQLDKNNYAMSECNLLMNPEVPEDCDLLLMYAPANDLTEDERDAVLSYLKEGGKVMVILGETSGVQLPNLEAVMKEYGMEPVEGFIADPTRCYQGNAYYVFPELSVHGDMAKGISSEMVLLIFAQGLNLVDAARDTISVHSFMSTSSEGYAVTEESETQGTYALGAVAAETVGGKNDQTEDESEESADDGEEENAEKESRLTVITSASMIDAQITDTFTTLENITLFMNAVTANFDGVENISVEPKSLAVEYNTVQHIGVLSLFAIFGIPILLLIGGFVIWFKRRRA